MSKTKIISLIQIILIIAVIVLLILNPRHRVVGYDSIYYYKLSKHTFTNSIISDYDTYKKLMKANKQKVIFKKGFFETNYLYIIVEENGMCNKDKVETLEAKICYDSNELQVYKNISCFKDCEKDDIIYMLNVSKNTDLKEGDLKLKELKRYVSCK